MSNFLPKLEEHFVKDLKFKIWLVVKLDKNELHSPLFQETTMVWTRGQDGRDKECIQNFYEEGSTKYFTWKIKKKVGGYIKMGLREIGSEDGRWMHLA